eukprot:gene26993-9004_t
MQGTHVATGGVHRGTEWYSNKRDGDITQGGITDSITLVISDLGGAGASTTTSSVPGLANTTVGICLATAAKAKAEAEAEAKANANANANAKAKAKANANANEWGTRQDQRNQRSQHSGEYQGCLAGSNLQNAGLAQLPVRRQRAPSVRSTQLQLHVLWQFELNYGGGN